MLKRLTMGLRMAVWQAVVLCERQISVKERKSKKEGEKGGEKEEHNEQKTCEYPENLED